MQLVVLGSEVVRSPSPLLFQLVILTVPQISAIDHK
jgi:hypothetical protein